MSILKRWFRKAQTGSQLVAKQTEDQLVAKLDPWGLACAVGAMNGSIYGHIGSHGTLDFDLWFRCCQKNDWKSATGANENEIRDALRSYAEKNQHKHMNQVLQEEHAKRGSSSGIVLGPGESMTIRIPLKLKDEE